MTAVLVLALWASAVPQTPTEVAALADLRLFHALLDRYVEGDEAAAVEMSAWEPARVLRMHVYIESSGDTARVWDRHRFEAAAMLHADAAVVLMEGGEDEARKIELVLFQFDIGGQLLKRAAARWRMREFTSRWYVATARVLRDRNWLTTTERHLALARDRLVGDAGVLYESGTLAELLASDSQIPKDSKRSPGVDQSVRRDPWSPFTFDDIRRRHTLFLNRAAGWLKQALAHDAGAMIRLHYGRVQYLRGESAEAAGHLARAARTADGGVVYLASMFLGALHERESHYDAALEAFRHAHQAFPTGQAAYVAMSGMLHRAGRTEAARDLLYEGLRIELDLRHDPWWHYFYEPNGVADRRLAAIRHEVRR